MQVQERYLRFEKGGREIKLQVQEEKAVVKMCQQVNLDKEGKEDSELIVAQVMLVLASEESQAPVPKEVALVLNQFPDGKSNYPTTLQNMWPQDNTFTKFKTGEPETL